jgi:hypothetical protein
MGVVDDVGITSTFCPLSRVARAGGPETERYDPRLYGMARGLSKPSPDRLRQSAHVSGGGFRHGQHLAFDENNHPPLCNLYISMLQRMGIAADNFGSGNATLTGLEMRG